MLALAEKGATFHFISTIGIPLELAVDRMGYIHENW